MKVNILRANFTIQANCPMQNYFRRQLTPKAQKESQQSSQMKKFTTFSQANNKQKQAVKKTTSPDEPSDNYLAFVIALFPVVTVAVGRDRKIRTALRTNQIVEFVTVPSLKK